MQQIKIFTGIEGELSKLESAVNGWIAEAKPKSIVQVFGNMAPQAMLPGADVKRVGTDSGSRRFAPSDVFLCIVYEA